MLSINPLYTFLSATHQKRCVTTSVSFKPYRARYGMRHLFFLTLGVMGILSFLSAVPSVVMAGDLVIAPELMKPRVITEGLRLRTDTAKLQIYIPRPACSGLFTKEPDVSGPHKALSHAKYGMGAKSIAIANRGVRAVVGGEDGNLYYYHRSKVQPSYVFNTLAAPIGGVAMSVADGASYVAGDGNGTIYLFECDSNKPVWTYNIKADAAPNEDVNIIGVAISAYGEWIAAITESRAYLFRRDSATPVYKADFTSKLKGASLASVALNSSGTHWVLGTTPDKTTAANHSLFVMQQSNQLWQYTNWSYTAAQTSGGCSANDEQLQVAISGNGKIAAGGCDGYIRFWNVASSNPVWSHQLKNKDGVAQILSLALSDHGLRLAVSAGDTLFYIENTNKAPNFSSNGWQFNGWWLEGYAQPKVYGVHDKQFSSGGDSYLGVSEVALSADGDYIFASSSSGSSVYSMHFYRKFNHPYRLVNPADTVGFPSTVALSPDGSWSMMGNGNAVTRIEVAPAVLTKVIRPLTFSVADTEKLAGQLAKVIGGSEFEIDYYVLKPGRAASLDMDWSIWSSITHVLSPLLCQGKTSDTVKHDLSDGNKIAIGTLKIKPPKCLNSALSGVELMLLHVDLDDRSTNKALSNDSGVLANIQVGGKP